MIGESEVPRGESVYTIPGTHSWTCPAGVTSVSVVCVGGGGSDSGGGGGLGYKNNYSVTPGSSYTVVVGKGGIFVIGTSLTQGTRAGNDSYFVNTSTVKGGGGGYGGGTGGTYVGDGGGNGGNGQYGGGGAGGYSGDGGDATNGSGSGQSGSGGGGGAGYEGNRSAGGGVGLFGQGASGAGAQGGSDAYSFSNGAEGGSGGEDAFRQYPSGTTSNQDQAPAPIYGGGGSDDLTEGCHGGNGAVRIVWPGDTRQFPSTDVGTP